MQIAAPEKLRKKPHRKGREVEQRRLLLLEDFPGSFWFLVLIRYLTFLWNLLMK